MKNLYVLILFFILLFSNKKAFSQAAYFDSKIYIDSISSTTNTKYHLKLKFHGINIPMQYVTRNRTTGQLFYGDSVPNIANNNSGNALNIFYSYAINASNLFDTVATVVFVPKRNKAIKILSIAPNTSGLCNGELGLRIDTLGINFNPMSGQFVYGGIDPHTTNTAIQSFNTNILLNTFCPGKHGVIWLTNNTGTTASEGTTIIFGLNYMPTASTISVSVNPYSVANGTSCTGKAQASASGGQAPYLYSFNNGAFSSTDSITGLCAGIHLLRVVDGNQDTVAKNFIITNNSNTYNNPNTNGTVADTIVLNVANCVIDYSLPIDSAFIASYTFTNANTLAISFIIWQAGNSTIISDTINYPFQNNSNYMISLILYCGSQKMITSNFSGKRVNDYVYASNLPVKIKEIISSSDLTTVYPNPFTNELSVDVKSTVDVTSIKMVNILGENLNVSFEKQTNGYKLNTDNLSKGVYFIKIVFGTKESKTIKIIKQ